MPYQTRGKFFEDFSIGDEIISQGRTITETDVVNFAAFSGDWTQLHTDVEYARTNMFGERIAHGLLGLSVMTGLLAGLGLIEGTVIAFAGLDWKFKAPIKIGDTLYLIAGARLVALDPVTGQKKWDKDYGGRIGDRERYDKWRAVYQEHKATTVYEVVKK